MNFFGYGIPIGRYFGINVSLHFTFVIFAFFQVQNSPDPLLGLLFVGGIWLCILLHEFGHALAARWCDGDADHILLWPLGGLAFVRPAWHPTAHLITTVMGPFVTLVLWPTLHLMAWVADRWLHAPGLLVDFLYALSEFNLKILLFNLIPAFPMDGGRMVRDTLWHFMRAERATAIAINLSKVLAVVVVVLILSPKYFWAERLMDWEMPLWLVKQVGRLAGDYWMLIFPAFILFQSQDERLIVAAEATGNYQFNLRDRIRHGSRRRQFNQAVQARRSTEAALVRHVCAACGLTEVEQPTMDFRVCPSCANGEEYCAAHLDAHSHR